MKKTVSFIVCFSLAAGMCLPAVSADDVSQSISVTEFGQYAAAGDTVPVITGSEAAGRPDVYGDINEDGKADLTDLSSLSLYLIGDRTFTDEQKKAADVDGDGSVMLTDLAKYRQYLSKVINTLGPEVPDHVAEEINRLRTEHPEYFGLETGKGIEVYAWRDISGKNVSVLMAGTNRNKEIDEIMALTPVSFAEMKYILNDYNLGKESIEIIPVGLNHYKQLGFETDRVYADRIIKYFENDSLTDITDLTLRGDISTDSAIERFYKDDDYEYTFSSVKSQYVECTFLNGSKMNIRDALSNNLASITDLDLFGIPYAKKPADSNNSDEPFSIQKYSEEHAFETVEIDIDRDGKTEKCVLSYGPTSGLFTVIFSVYADDVLKYRNTVNLEHYRITTVTEEEGEIYLKRYADDPAESVYNRIHIEDRCIVIDDLTEYEWYWGGPDCNINVIPEKTEDDSDGLPLPDPETAVMKAVVDKVYDDGLMVTQTDDQWKPYENDLYYVRYSMIKNLSVSPGDRIEIEFSGLILTTYPCQFSADEIRVIS